MNSRPPILEYADAGRNETAHQALVTGLLPIPFLGIRTIKLGRRGVEYARLHLGKGRQMSLVALALASINLIISTLLVTVGPVLLIGYLHERRKAAAVQNLALIGQAILLYANDNKGAYPPTLDTLLETSSLQANSLTSPITGGRYVYPQLNHDQAMILVSHTNWLRGDETFYDVPLVWDSHPSTRGAAVLFQDLHVEWLDAKTFDGRIRDRLSGRLSDRWAQKLTLAEQRALATQPSP